MFRLRKNMLFRAVESFENVYNDRIKREENSESIWISFIAILNNVAKQKYEVRYVKV